MTDLCYGKDVGLNVMLINRANAICLALVFRFIISTKFEDAMSIGIFRLHPLSFYVFTIPCENKVSYKHTLIAIIMQFPGVNPLTDNFVKIEFLSF